ncbi:MAG: DNA-binding protein [Nitrososphaeraceae archaeon]
MNMASPNNPNEEDFKKREAEAEAMRQRIMMALLDPSARQRLANVRMVKPDLAQAVENYLVNAASTGRLNHALSDEELKRILLSIQSPKKDFKINRI